MCTKSGAPAPCLSLYRLLAHGLRASAHGSVRLAMAHAYQRCMRSVAAALGQNVEDASGGYAKRAPGDKQKVSGSSSSSSSSDLTTSSDSCSDGESIAGVSADESDSSSCSNSGSESGCCKDGASSCSYSGSRGSTSFCLPSQHGSSSGPSQREDKREGQVRSWKPRPARVVPCFSMLGAGACAYIALVRSVLGSKQVSALHLLRLLCGKQASRRVPCVCYVGGCRAWATS